MDSTTDNVDKETFLKNLGFEGQQLKDLLANKKISEAIVQMAKEVCSKQKFLSSFLLLKISDLFFK
jgi:hypothetical protein